MTRCWPWPRAAAETVALQAANAKDIEAALAAGLAAPLVDRLRLTPQIIETVAEGCLQLAAMPDPSNTAAMSCSWFRSYCSNVGYTARHHTFFEMLGNFSFGDYFKRDAIQFAWELLTKVYGLPADKLWTTVYIDDDEAYDIWTKEIGVPAERCVRIGDNKGAEVRERQLLADGRHRPLRPVHGDLLRPRPEVSGGPPGSPEADGDRYIEIWNLVFMQFNRDDKGVMHPLPKPSVDTGMGLERLAAVLQHVHSNYEIDLFQDLIRAAARETGAEDFCNPSLRVIADHIRACAFLIVDGVIPGNEGRGYVLRRIIRRAIRHGYKLGQKQPFFHKLVEDLDRVMGDAYPELRRDKARVAQVLKQEEERFGETLENGMKILEQALASGGKRCSTARPCSSSTTPSASRSTSPPTSAASATSPSTRPASTRAMEQAARARARREPVQDRRAARLRGAEDAIPRLRHAVRRGPRRRALPRRRAGAVARGRRARRGRARPRRRSTPSPAARSATAASSPRAASA